MNANLCQRALIVFLFSSAQRLQVSRRKRLTRQTGRRFAVGLIYRKSTSPISAKAMNDARSRV
jgi:hypothetical protein